MVKTLLDDLIVEVLFYLPVKSLAKCKCLSKKWNHFISHNSSFRQTYLLRSPASPSLFLGFFLNKRIGSSNDFDDGEPQVRFLPTCDEGNKLSTGDTKTWGLPSPFDESLGFLGSNRVFLVDSSNGFLLCCVEEYNPLSYFVCNPIIKQSVALPKPKMTSLHVHTGFVCRGRSPCLDSVSYTVVRGIWPDETSFTNTLTIEIFSSSTTEWKILNLSCPSSFHLHLSSNLIFINEEDMLHFVVMADSSTEGILVFDQNNEGLQLTPVPGGYYWASKFDIWNGYIVHARHNKHELEVWMLDAKDEHDHDEVTKQQWSLKRHGEITKQQWSLKCRVKVPTDNHPFPWESYFEFVRLHPLKFGLFIYIVFGDNIIWYDVENSKMELVRRLGAYSPQEFFPYVCSSWPPLFP